MKSIIILAVIFLGCIALNEALQCYSHAFCGTNCPQLNEATETCQGDQNKCYKAAVPGGVKRGCASKQCNVEVNANSIMANVCCEKDLCNSAITSKLTLSTLFMVISAFFLARL